MQTITAQPQEKNWGDDPRRAPELLEGDQLIYSECGRVLHNTCYRSHYFRLVRKYGGMWILLVRHGGGDERICLNYAKHALESLALLDSDSRYLMLHLLHETYGAGKRYGADLEAARYQKAFVDGKLKKRKIRGQSAVKVWIET
jgi:hypothetical protein